MNNEKIFVSENDEEIINSWYENVSSVTRDTLSDFIQDIMDKCEFDYGSYIHAITACTLATSWACGKQLSGFQASCVGLQFIKQWTYPHNVSGIGVRNWDDMLYPQYDFKFEKVIPREIWINLQKEAQTKFNDTINDTNLLKNTSGDVLSHWKSIADGEVPFGYTISEN